jgi:hypothetical protein
MLDALSTEPLLLSALDYWERKRGARPLPERRDIDPLELDRRLLPHLLLIEIDGMRYRFRLVGTEIVRRLGFDPTGRQVEDVLSGAYRDHVLAINRALVATRRPTASLSLHRWDDDGCGLTRRIAMPLANGDEDVAMLLVAQVFAPLAGATAPAPAFHALSAEDVEMLLHRRAA